ncbi:BON domain-containing protein [Glaciecola sp. 2405UD65-10]|uniref:BON domain-containing protein n=1 Tax=Glaciecola sp. 2405UD65-10 TaxID=3397244 RepID=UPI003B5A9FAE
MKRTLLSLALVTGLSTSAMAGTNTWEKEAMDAWIDGKAEATLLFNGNLDSFDINTDVSMGKLTLTGKVENKIEKELAEELVMGIDGVKGVDNRLVVVNEEMDAESEEASQFTDAKISTVITSRLLFDSEVSGLDIDVDVDNREVTLNGTVDSEAERDLAIAIAKNTNDVSSVNDELMIENEAE